MLLIFSLLLIIKFGIILFFNLQNDKIIHLIFFSKCFNRNVFECSLSTTSFYFRIYVIQNQNTLLQKLLYQS